MKNRSLIHVALVLVSLGLFACSGSSGDDGKGGSPGGQAGPSSSSSSQTCTQHWGCVGGNCACADGPNKDKACCDPATDGCSGPNNCDDFCKVCTSS